MAKYGRIIYAENPALPEGFCNLGDFFQTFAVENLYRTMGIQQEDIVDVSRYGLRDYDGEELILPLQGWFGHHVKGAEIFPMSPKIRPVFVGFHCLSKRVLDVKSLKQWEPIGCRDEATYRLLSKCGIEAYISGCLTVTLPDAEPDQKSGEVLLIDADAQLREMMPPELLSRAVELHQECTGARGGTYFERAAYYEAQARKQYERMSRASMIVTSRLHCAGPATAMGIPVILAKPYFDERYTWIDLYQTLYTRKDYGNINWNAPAPNISKEKKLLLDNAAAAIRNDPQTEKLHERVHQMYLQRTRGKISVPFYRKAFVLMHENFPEQTEMLRKILVEKHPYH